MGYLLKQFVHYIIIYMQKRILVVEDSPQWQKFHKSMLDECTDGGFYLRIASSAREGVEIVEEEDAFDLIFSDLQMETDFQPMLAGEWFVETVKKSQKTKKSKIVLVSATYNIGFIAAKLGVDYLSKRTIINFPDAYFSLVKQIFSA